MLDLTFCFIGVRDEEVQVEISLNQMKRHQTHRLSDDFNGIRSDLIRLNSF